MPLAFIIYPPHVPRCVLTLVLPVLFHLLLVTCSHSSKNKAWITGNRRESWFSSAPLQTDQRGSQLVIVVKNLPASVADMDSIPGLGRFHMHRATNPMRHNHWVCALETMLCNYWACLLHLLKPKNPEACAPQQENPQKWDAHTTQQRGAPAHYD